MDDNLSRRHFIGAAVASSAVGCSSDEPSEPIASERPPKIPTRPLGKTGENPSILALGCGSRLLMYEDEEKGVEAINNAIDANRTVAVELTSIFLTSGRINYTSKTISN